MYQPQTANDNCVQIKHHDNNTSSKDHDTHHQLHTDTDDNVNSFNAATLDSLSQCWPKDWLPLGMISNCNLRAQEKYNLFKSNKTDQAAFNRQL